MKILLLLGTFCYPPRNGGDQALINAIDKLNSYVDFHLISVAESENQRVNLDAFHKAYPNIQSSTYIIRKNSYQRISSFFSRIANAINRRIGNCNAVNMQYANVYEPKFSLLNDFYLYIDKYICDNRIEIVQSEFWFTLGRLSGITSNVKRVFVQHEIQYVVNSQRLKQRPHDESDEKYLEAMRRSEINAMNSCDAIITLSYDDKNRLIDDGVHTPIFASFAQLKFKEFSYDNKFISCRKLVFIGPETHLPNKQGVEWFLNNVWPQVISKQRDIQLDIIGCWTENTIKNWSQQYQNINFLGYVDDLKHALDKSILIVPIFQGSGIRMKILEACNLGVPVVSSTIGAEGLGLVNGKNAFITDNGDYFFENIITLLNSPEITTKFVIAANQHIKDNFSDEKFIESRMKCYKFLCPDQKIKEIK